MKSYSTGQKIVPSSDTLFNQVGAESVLLNLKNENYYGLDETGTRMWLALTTSDSIQAAQDKLIEEYEVQHEILSRDLQLLIDRLLEHKLIEIHD